jgi:hypothetical protein
MTRSRRNTKPKMSTTTEMNDLLITVPAGQWSVVRYCTIDFGVKLEPIVALAFHKNQSVDGALCSPITTRSGLYGMNENNVSAYLRPDGKIQVFEEQGFDEFLTLDTLDEYKEYAEGLSWIHEELTEHRKNLRGLCK